MGNRAENFLPYPEIIAHHPPLVPTGQILQAEANDILRGLLIPFRHPAMQAQTAPLVELVERPHDASLRNFF